MNTKAATICLNLVCVVSISVQAGILTVTNTNDNGLGSLRQALVNANVGDTIDATGITGVITLTSGELLVNNNVTINGAGADLLAVDGNAAGTVFQVMSMGPVTISDLTIRNAQGRFGGGIFNGGVGTLTIINSALSGNTAAFGGGIYNGGTLNIVNSTISGNAANEGAGIYNAVTLTIINSTFSNNTASQIAGGVFNTGTLEIANSTISNNSSMFLAGGVVNLNNFQIGNTILNEGGSGANIYNNSNGVVMSLGFNISSDDAFGILTGPGDQINTNPMLGPLQNNGGPTFTHQLLPGSPAINTGDPNAPARDQRYYLRNGPPDRGAFEFAGTLAPLSAASRKMHGAAGTFDVDLPISGNAGIECRSGGANGDHQMVMTFATPVMVVTTSVASGVGVVSNASVNGSQVTVNLTGVANAQRIVLTLSGVSDGANMNNVNIPMSLLLGDLNASGGVNSTDISSAKAKIGQPVSVSNFRADVNANGTINASDVGLVKSKVGTGLP